MMILDENDLMLATWMSDGAANIRKIGESFNAGKIPSLKYICIYNEVREFF